MYGCCLNLYIHISIYLSLFYELENVKYMKEFLAQRNCLTTADCGCFCCYFVTICHFVVFVTEHNNPPREVWSIV